MPVLRVNLLFSLYERGTTLLYLLYNRKASRFLRLAFCCMALPCGFLLFGQFKNLPGVYNRTC